MKINSHFQRTLQICELVRSINYQEVEIAYIPKDMGCVLILYFMDELLCKKYPCFDVIL